MLILTIGTTAILNPLFVKIAPDVGSFMIVMFLSL